MFLLFEMRVPDRNLAQPPPRAFFHPASEGAEGCDELIRDNVTLEGLTFKRAQIFMIGC